MRSLLESFLYNDIEIKVFSLLSFLFRHYVHLGVHVRMFTLFRDVQKVDVSSKKEKICHFEPFNLDFSKKYTVCYSQENCDSSLTLTQSTSYI